MKKYPKEERELAKLVGDQVVQKVLDKVKNSSIKCKLCGCSNDIDEALIDYMRVYAVEVYPDGSCDLIHERSYEKPEGEEKDMITFEDEGENEGEEVEDEEVNSEGERTYSLKLKCANCGHSWNKEIPFGTDFFPFSLGDTYWEAGYGTPSSLSGHRDGRSLINIHCPKCGSYRVDREAK